MSLKFPVKIIILLLIVMVLSMIIPYLNATELENTNIDEMKIINPEWGYLMIVNKEYILPKGYAPLKMKVPEVDTFGNYYVLEEKTAIALEKMLNDARKEGVDIALVSAYRDESTQRILFDQLAYWIGEEKASEAIAYPGTSEHQTGMAVDLSTRELGVDVSKGFQATKAFEWMQENCYNYGFILRYPEGKEAITKYKYEPWHYRFVDNVFLAQYLTENQLTLEEFYIEQGIYGSLDSMNYSESSIVFKQIYWGMKLRERLDQYYRENEGYFDI